ncbi:type 1 glutamine amidotransferase [Corynebacterium caspium]|uniref:type 1 glutamine amidotransferase n=1 Tax=Corynebacterium caspium TaxID=234828 RepID=UPI00037A28EA|nr:hypothetical protein [Corynebacterium caspium]WKD58540.1 cobyric acid synthase [Corynebacterium caspium DSM 44850]
MIRIGLVLPDVLGTYGDSGNALVLRQRARMRHMEAEIIPLHLGDPIPADLSVYTLGGGEDASQRIALEHLRNDGGLEAAANAGRPILAICAGLQILGNDFDGLPGLGLLDISTSPQEKRAIGELRSMPLRAAVPELTEPLTGFENHLGATSLGPKAAPLATVSQGVGNGIAAEQSAGGAGGAGAAGAAGGATGGAGAPEGVVQGSIIATYMHGPVLARNPQLADLLLARALGIPLAELPALDIPVVDRLRLERLA